MVDTSIKHALLMSIEEFNQWCEQKNSFSKYSLAELKGVFFNKLMGNLKGTTAFHNYFMKKQYSPEYIGTFVVSKNKISNLSFQKGDYSYQADVNKTIDELNLALTTINLDSISGIIPDFAAKIESFKVKV